jgi:DNA invertase Pin-like site-specific DNA recombinase
VYDLFINQTKGGNMKKVILYGRVSTDEQKRSGLGILAQIEEMRKFAETHNLEIVDVREEYVSGKYYLDRRPVLQKAFDDARRIKDCIVLAAKMDRVMRSELNIHRLIDDGEKFITAETGIRCTALELSLRSMIAQEERRKTAERTKAAFAAKRERGEPMGMHNPKIRRHLGKAIERSREAVTSEADAFAEFMQPNIERMRNSGMSVNAMADELNKYGIKTARGKKWHAKTVCNLMARLDKIS